MTLNLQTPRIFRQAAIHFFLMLAVSPFALAHQPFWNEASHSLEQAFVIENPTISKAIFGNLQPGEVDYFLLEAPQGWIQEASLFAGEGCAEDFTPKLFLLSPGAELTSQVTFEMPKGYGLTEATGDWTPYQGHGLKGRKGPTLRLEATSNPYYFVVEAGQQGGFYLLSLSGSEVFGGSAEGREAIPRFNLCQ